FFDCPGFAPCADVGPGLLYDPSSRTIRTLTDVNGRASFPSQSGGVCSGLAVRIFADGVFLGQRNLASPDQDGNLIAQLADLGLVSSKAGSTDPTADFDCDGHVTQSDLDFMKPHAGHRCPPTDPTPTIRSTWGGLKIIYR